VVDRPFKRIENRAGNGIKDWVTELFNKVSVIKSLAKKAERKPLFLQGKQTTWKLPPARFLKQLILPQT
jgi:hypothetical protein